MSAIHPHHGPLVPPRARTAPSPRDAPATIALRVGSVVAIGLVLSLTVNLFAGGLAFCVLLTALAFYAAHHASVARRQQRARPAAEDGEPLVRGDASDEPATAAVLAGPLTPPLPPSTPAAGASASSS
jgi:predicted lipid-binding transport protein (Tim44 family)